MKLVKLKPAIKQYIWGGTYFKDLGKGNGGEQIISECWELSDRGNDSSIIVSGPNKGQKLCDVITPKDIGPVYKKYEKLPLLIKLIDAQENLSVQVHPCDKYAQEHENSLGKAEMWYIIDADEGSGLYVGLKQKSNREEIEKALQNGTILDYLNFVEVKPGEAYFIKPGTIHAIGKGVRLLEVQENSDITYRLYDYNRLDKNGNPRELHIEKGLDVIDYEKYKQESQDARFLVNNEYFVVERVFVMEPQDIKTNDYSFVSFTFLDGKGDVDGIKYGSYDTFFLPFGQTCHINGTGTIIRSYLIKYYEN